VIGRPWFVIAGQGDELRFAPTSRPSTCFGAASKDVDARHKAGHDGVEGVVTRSLFTRVGSLPCSVMGGRRDETSLRADVPAVVRHGRACPGHPRS